GRLRDVTRLGVGVLLGIGLAAVYMFPALAHQRYVSAGRYLLSDPIFQWRNNFPPLDGRLLRREGSWPSYVQFMGVLLILSASMVICLVIFLARGAGRVFWTGVAGASLFMMVPLSAPVWRMIPALANL